MPPPSARARTPHFLNFAPRRHTQLYAGSKYARADVEAVRPGDALAHARPPEPGMMDASDSEADDGGGGGGSGGLRKVYPFTVTPSQALQRVQEVIRCGQLARAPLSSLRP
eukprot:354133-Chlamydomonas_euryale.AAC.2